MLELVAACQIGFSFELFVEPIALGSNGSGVNFLGTDDLFGDDADAVVLDLDKTAHDSEEMLIAICIENPQRPKLERRDDRRVIDQHLEGSKPPGSVTACAEPL